MKKITLSLSFMILAGLIYGQWNNYNLVTDNIQFNEVHFTDSLNGWMIGSNIDNGHLVIYHTINGGKTLDVQYENNSYNGYYSSIYFVNATSGWAVCEEIILHTDDGGQTWNEQGVGISTNGGLDVFFIDGQTGWIAGSDVIKNTTDGGLSWNEQSFPSSSLNNIQFIDNQKGWAVGWYSGGHGIFLKTNDGGISWEETVINDIRLEDIVFTSETIGWIIGQKHQEGTYKYHPRILKSTDGGTNWFEQYAENDGSSVDMNLHFIDSMHGWASYGWWGPSSQILYTEDGGVNWIKRDDIITLDLINSIFFIDSQHGYMVGDKGILLRTQNTGQNWATKGFYNKPIHSVSFADDLNGMALMVERKIMFHDYYLIKTNDGGENWEVQRPLLDDPYSPGDGSHLFMHDSLHLTLIPSWCEYDRFYQSADGGLTWDTIALPSNNSTHYCGQFINPDTGWIVKTNSNQGTSVLRTYTGGYNWEEFQMSTNDYSINAVFFFPAPENSGFGCAVGTDYSGNGVIYTTTDSGETWQQINWDVPLNDIFFTDEYNGWIVGGDEDNHETIILRTSDGGLNWVVQESGTDNGLNSVWFTNDETGWIAGNNGTILYTSNGGEYWELSPCPVEENLYSTCFVNQQTGWIGGVGALLQYDGIWTAIPGTKVNSGVKGFEVFPNPSTGKVSIGFNFTLQSEISLSIVNSKGQEIKFIPLGRKMSGSYELNCSEFSSGIYFITVKTESEIITEKLIIK